MVSTDLRTMNVLVVSGGGYQGLALIKCFRVSESIRIVMVDRLRENVCKYLVDRFYVVPSVRETIRFLNALLEICEREKIDIVFPSTSIELVTLSENRDLFLGKGIHVAVSEPSILHQILNKKTLYSFLIQEGLSILPILDIMDDDLPFPIFGKPVDGWGGKGTLTFRSINEVHKHDLSELKNGYVWQPLLDDFEEYSVDCVLNFNGVASELIVRKRLCTIGGFAAIAESIVDSNVEAIAKRFFNLIGIKGGCGLFNLQILKKDSNYFLSDVNPRMGTSAVFSLRIGLNLPLILCSNLKPDIGFNALQQRHSDKKVKMIRYLEESWVEEGNYPDAKAIVFDLDDTLLNQKLWMFNKLEILHALMSSFLPEKRIFLLKATQAIEEGNRGKVFDVLTQDFNLNEDVKNRLIKTYREIEPKICPLFPEVKEALGEIKKKGIPMALITDNPVMSQKQKIKVCNLEEIFDVIVYSRELGHEKPHRVVFDRVAELLGIPPRFLIMVGDNLYRDVIGALEADYEFAYWVERKGTFFNFDRYIYAKLFDNLVRVAQIGNLRDLLWSLRLYE